MNEKNFAIAVSTFCVGFGVLTCQLPDFLCGIFAGMALMLTVDVLVDTAEE